MRHRECREWLPETLTMSFSSSGLRLSLAMGGGGRGLLAMGTHPMAAARAKGNQAATDAILPAPPPPFASTLNGSPLLWGAILIDRTDDDTQCDDFWRCGLSQFGFYRLITPSHLNVFQCCTIPSRFFFEPSRTTDALTHIHIKLYNTGRKFVFVFPLFLWLFKKKKSIELSIQCHRHLCRLAVDRFLCVDLFGVTWKTDAPNSKKSPQSFSVAGRILWKSQWMESNTKWNPHGRRKKKQTKWWGGFCHELFFFCWCRCCVCVWSSVLARLRSVAANPTGRSGNGCVLPPPAGFIGNIRKKQANQVPPHHPPRSLLLLVPLQ